MICVNTLSLIPLPLPLQPRPQLHQPNNKHGYITNTQKGLLNGLLNWDDSSESSVFQIQTKLAKHKSILLNSIETLNSDNEHSPLQLEIWPAKTINTKSPKSFEFLLTKSQDAVAADGDDYYYSDDYNEHEHDDDIDLKKGSSKSNYMAVIGNYIDSHKDSNKRGVESAFGKERLEIGAKLLVLNLIVDNNNHHNSLAPSVVDNSNQPNVIMNSANENSSKSKWSASQQHLGNQKIELLSPATKRLFEFNDEQQSITLPLESKLNLSPHTTSALTSGSLVVNGKLKSSIITGALDRNLE